MNQSHRSILPNRRGAVPGGLACTSATPRLLRMLRPIASLEPQTAGVGSGGTQAGRWSRLARIGAVLVALVVVLLVFSACAGPSEEERCKASGGAWREKESRCESSSR